MTHGDLPEAIDDAVRARVATLCHRLGKQLGPAATEPLHDIEALLHTPLCIAIVGRVSAGKSTLVNALLGRRFAPTAAGECTRVVTWYRYGRPDRAEIVLRDGSRQPLVIADHLPARLPVAVNQVEHVDVWLQAGALRDHTLIDTPGLATLDRARVAVDADVPDADTRRAADAADALVFLFRDAERRDEIDFLRQLRGAPVGAGVPSAVIGVLSHADLMGEGPWSQHDPFDVAQDRATEMRRDRRTEVSTVLPVSGLLAETSRTGVLRDDDARLLARLDGIDRRRLQMWRRVGLPQGIDDHNVTRLFEMLGPYGVDRGRTHARHSAAVLRRWLEQRSGVAALEQEVRYRFAGHAAALKAEHALTALDDLVAAIDIAEDARFAARSAIESARLHDDLHVLQELRALDILTRGGRRDDLADALKAVSTGGTLADRLQAAPDTPVDELRRLARQRAAEAQARRATASDAVSKEAARVLARSYFLLSRRSEP